MQTNIQAPKYIKVVEHNTPPTMPPPPKMCMPTSMTVATAQAEMCNTCPMQGKTVHTTGTPKKYYCQ